MPRMNHTERQLYIAVFAALMGEMANKGKAKPQGTAHRAREFAIAAVIEHRIKRRQ